MSNESGSRLLVAAQVAAALITALTGVAVFFLNQSIRRVDTTLREREIERAESADSSEIRFKVYEAVTQSLETNDSRRQAIARTLVTSMLRPEEELREGLLTVLVEEGGTEVKRAAASDLRDQRQFREQQPAPAAAAVEPDTADWQSYAIDVFWCDGANNQGDAARLQAALVKGGADRARVRLRPLPASINASPGYRISGLVIRRDEAEEQVSRALKQVADAALGTFDVTLSRQGTRGYLSAFVCR